MRAYRISALVIATAFAGAALAKLPAPNEEAKAKAAEAKAKTDWSTKVAAYQLCKSQDKVAAKYLADAGKAGKDVKPAAAGAACADPGAFAYTPTSTPAPRPIEAAGAHSPPETAIKPPSTTTPAAATTPTPKQ